MYSMEFKLFGLTFRLEVVVICVIVGWMLCAHLLCSCAKVSLKEGMQLLGAPVSWEMEKHVPGSWTSKANKYANGMGYQENSKRYQAYTGTQVPLPPDQMLFFADNEFKPECCPTTYSNGSGCACPSSEQVKYLNERGGNRSMAPSDF